MLLAPVVESAASRQRDGAGNAPALALSDEDEHFVSLLHTHTPQIHKVRVLPLFKLLFEGKMNLVLRGNWQTMLYKKQG